jgi:hypothetical protein
VLRMLLNYAVDIVIKAAHRKKTMEGKETGRK